MNFVASFARTALPQIFEPEPEPIPEDNNFIYETGLELLYSSWFIFEKIYDVLEYLNLNNYITSVFPTLSAIPWPDNYGEQRLVEMLCK